MNERERCALDQLRVDRAVVEAAAVALDDPQTRATWAGLSDARTAHLLAELLQLLAEALPELDSAIRHVTVQAARDLTGDRMDQPTVRRTRRRR